jgi:hypothetical protein
MMAGHETRIWEMRNTFRIIIGKPEARRPHGKCSDKWNDNIKMDLT